ncbi:MAG: flavodoxin [Dysgonamonadaceae bacterium]|jgi:flavodoxin I|nr:flavodoxin [Dysgonamonadaceae bacterium]
MSKIGIFYGSSGGNTEGVAKNIAKKLGIEANDVYDVCNAKADDLSAYDVLLFGSSTWGLGDLQDDWEGFIKTVASADLSGKKVALFGCGDSSSYCDTFCDAIGKIYQAVKDKATVVGFTDTAGYSFDSSESVVNGQFAGLPIDEDNESNLTESRIEAWIAQLKKELA